MANKKNAEDKAEEAIERLKRHTREANEATADLRAVLKQVKEYAPEMVEAALRAEVTKQLGVLQAETKVAIDKSSAAVVRRFDTLAAILLGENKRDEKSLPQIVDEAVALRERMEAQEGRGVNG